jgi:hypothetical protein
VVGELVVVGVGLIGPAAVLGGCWWFARRVRRTGVGMGVLGPVDEIYHPAAHRYRQEIQEYEQRAVPLPGAADPER